MAREVVKDLAYDDFTYTGEVLDGVPDGTGKCVFSDGGTYEGTFLGGKQDGRGIRHFASGIVYEGEYKDGERHGKGVMRWASGNSYEGDFVVSKRTGKGIFRWANGDVYEGDFVNGVRTGKGWVLLRSGEYYQGDFLENNITGKGLYIYNNGSAHSGSFVNGKQKGFGKSYYRTRERAWFFDKQSDTLLILGDLSRDTRTFPANDRIRTVVAGVGASVYSAGMLFAGMRNLRHAELSSLDVSKCGNMSRMFDGCSALASLDLSKWDTSAARNMDSMFEGCSSLLHLNAAGWNTGSVIHMKDMFKGCGSLDVLDMTGWKIREDADTEEMFSGVPQTVTVQISSDLPEGLLPEGVMTKRPTALKPKPVAAGKKAAGKAEPKDGIKTESGAAEAEKTAEIPPRADPVAEARIAIEKALAKKAQTESAGDSGGRAEQNDDREETQEEYRAALEAIGTILHEAGAGNSLCQYAAGKLYYEGDVRHGVPTDKAKAAEWYEKAAAQGNISAIFKLADMYSTGDGIPADRKKAEELRESSVALKDINALCRLAYMYDTGDSVPMDRKKAEELYRAAAEQRRGDDSISLSWLGAECFIAAAEHHVPAAMVALGYLYNCGFPELGIPEDKDKAREIWIMEAKRGVETAKNALKEYFRMEYKKLEKIRIFTIDPDMCVGCASCEEVCPIGACAFDSSGVKCVIDQASCLSCGTCEKSCPTGAIH